jgi:hypothetical protein
VATEQARVAAKKHLETACMYSRMHDKAIAERDTALAALAQARSLLDELAAGIGHPNPDKREKKDCLLRARITAFLHPTASGK